MSLYRGLLGLKYIYIYIYNELGWLCSRDSVPHGLLREREGRVLLDFSGGHLVSVFVSTQGLR